MGSGSGITTARLLKQSMYGLPRSHPIARLAMSGDSYMMGDLLLKQSMYGLLRSHPIALFTKFLAFSTQSEVSRAHRLSLAGSDIDPTPSSSLAQVT